MSFKIYHYVDSQGRDDFKTWETRLQSVPRGKLKQKIDLLTLYGDGLYPHILTDSGVPGIQKLRVQGGVKLRPLLCKGPMNIASEYTLLIGAKEVGFKWKPTDAPITANQRKQEVISNPLQRRTDRGKII